MLSDSLSNPYNALRTDIELGGVGWVHVISVQRRTSAVRVQVWRREPKHAAEALDHKLSVWRRDDRVRIGRWPFVQPGRRWPAPIPHRGSSRLVLHASLPIPRPSPSQGGRPQCWVSCWTRHTASAGQRPASRSAAHQADQSITAGVSGHAGSDTQYATTHYAAPCMYHTPYTTHHASCVGQTASSGGETKPSFVLPDDGNGDVLSRLD